MFLRICDFRQLLPWLHSLMLSLLERMHFGMVQSDGIDVVLRGKSFSENGTYRRQFHLNHRRLQGDRILYPLQGRQRA